jgi:hypothetical protein
MTYHRSPARLGALFAVGAAGFVASQFAGTLTFVGAIAFGAALIAIVRRTSVTVETDQLRLARLVTHRDFPAGGAMIQSGRGPLGSAIYVREPGRIRETVDLALYSRADQRAIRNEMARMFKVGQVV